MNKVKWLFNVETISRGSGKYDGCERLTHARAYDMLFNSIAPSSKQMRDMSDKKSFWIICSSDAFVRFQVARCKAGCINRFRDLEVSIIENDRMDCSFTFEVD